MTDWLKKFMYGRYGIDQLSLGLIVLSITLSFVILLTRYSFLSFISYGILGMAYFRILSRNFLKRQQENRLFLRYWHPVKIKLHQNYKRFKDLRTHKYYKCPKCQQTLRVPRGKGKIRITCPKCTYTFSKKS